MKHTRTALHWLTVFLGSSRRMGRQSIVPDCRFCARPHSMDSKTYCAAHMHIDETLADSFSGQVKQSYLSAKVLLKSIPAPLAIFRRALL